MNRNPSRRSFLQAGLTVPLVAAGPLAGDQPAAPATRPVRRVRVAVIGVGGRGRIFTRACLKRDEVDVVALCDVRPEAARQGAELVQAARQQDPAIYTQGPHDYRRLLERDDLDAVFITTPTYWHGPMAIDSLRAGKWVFSEVPACYTLQECRDLVAAARESRGKYFLAENYCLFRSNMLVLNMVEKGLFGELTYAECGYIHRAPELMFDKDGRMTWRGELGSDPKYIGNTYPTHSLGPVGTWFGITRGDRFTRCVSLESKAVGRREWVTRKFGTDSPQARTPFWVADSVVSLINTESGGLIVVRKDVASARPHHMNMYTLQGSRASYDDERGIYLDGKSEGWEPLSRYEAQHDHPWWRSRHEQARAAGHGGGDFFTVRHFFDCLQRNAEPAFDVHDAVAWSALIELSKRSILAGGAPQEYPDFTDGEWKARSRHAWPEPV